MGRGGSLSSIPNRPIDHRDWMGTMLAASALSVSLAEQKERSGGSFAADAVDERHERGFCTRSDCVDLDAIEVTRPTSRLGRDCLP